MESNFATYGGAKHIIVVKLDYSLQSPQERLELIQRYVDECEQNGTEIAPAYLETLADYLIFCMEKQERKERKTKHEVLTSNHMITVNKHETSYEGLVETFEQGEDHIYNIMAPSASKHIYFTPKASITKKDIETIPFMKQLVDAINMWEQKLRGKPDGTKPTGREAYIIKQTIIDLRKDQYVLKEAYLKPITFKQITHVKSPVTLPSREYIDANGNVASEGLSFTNPTVVSLVLQNYSKLKEDGYDNFYDDVYFFMLDFDDLLGRALQKGSIYERIAILKVDGVQNFDIQCDLEQNFGVTYSPEYISSLWRHKIPNMIAQKAADEWLVWHYTFEEYGKWKRCGRCGQVKLAHNRFFSRNSSSRDGFYSICKECRRGQKS